jgi:hypothetical protein
MASNSPPRCPSPSSPTSSAVALTTPLDGQPWPPATGANTQPYERLRSPMNERLNRTLPPGNTVCQVALRTVLRRCSASLNQRPIAGPVDGAAAGLWGKVCARRFGSRQSAFSILVLSLRQLFILACDRIETRCHCLDRTHTAAAAPPLSDSGHGESLSCW